MRATVLRRKLCATRESRMHVCHPCSCEARVRKRSLGRAGTQIRVRTGAQKFAMHKQCELHRCA
eukprot:5821917-Alexandrium_andersonii.AAC.1